MSRPCVNCTKYNLPASYPGNMYVQANMTPQDQDQNEEECCVQALFEMN